MTSTPRDARKLATLSGYRPSKETLDDAELPGIFLPYLDVREMALLQVETRRDHIRPSSEPIAVLAHRCAKIHFESELRQLDKYPFMLSNQRFGGLVSGLWVTVQKSLHQVAG